MTDRELEKQAERDLSLNDTLIEAYTKGARTMQKTLWRRTKTRIGREWLISPLM